MNIDLGLFVLFAFAGIGVILMSILGFQIFYPKIQAYKRAKSNWDAIPYKGDDYGVIIQKQVGDYEQFVYHNNIFHRTNGHVDNVDVPISDKVFK
jgi:hypothetical protein